MVVPAPAGLGTPRWHGADRITVLGASSATTAADLAAAGSAGVAHQIADALDAVDAGSSADVLRVGGGLSAHDGLLQAVADLSGLTFEVPRDTEATARGIAALAAEAVGLLDERVAAAAIVQRVEPRLDDAGRARERARLEGCARGAHAGGGVSEGALGPGAARTRAVARLEREQLDVLVVGGGITGVGIALDAVSRGLSVGLIEARDLAAGTSSRSSKLIHGGLRYLEMLELRLVHEALRERRLLLTRLAPHLVRPVEFLFPLKHRGWERPYIGAGLLLYDMWAGRHLPRARHLSRRAALEAAPALRPESLIGAVRFCDAQEDDALYTVYVARTAAALGAAVATESGPLT